MTISCHNYHQLSISEREEISILTSAGASVSDIAIKLGRNKSTISRELRRHRYNAQYRASVAQNRADRAKRNNRKPRKAANPELMQQIERMIKLRWSPEIISHELGHAVSHTTIYTMTRTCRTEWGKYLIYRKKVRYHKGCAGKTPIPGRVDISERPPVGFGDFEADTVISARGGEGCLGVFAERTTRLYKVVKMAARTANDMVLAADKALAGLPVRSITYDNGRENAQHGEINRRLGCMSYFCRPYRSGDKGLVENRNKWLRVWLPKGTRFDLITSEELCRIETAINERPMKCLGWRSPIQAFRNAAALHFQL